MKHPLKFIVSKGLLADAFAIDRSDPVVREVEAAVQQALREGWNMRRLFEFVGEMDLTDEMWANFLYTYGWWDGRRTA